MSRKSIASLYATLPFIDEQQQFISATTATITEGATITGTTDINAPSGNTTNIGTGGTGAVNIGNVTGGTHITGPVSVTGGKTTLAALDQVGTTNINATGTDTTNLGTGSGPVNIGNTAATTTLNGNVTHTNGALTQAGITSINASGASATTIGTGGTGAVNIGNVTGGTSITGPIGVTGLSTLAELTQVGTTNINATGTAGTNIGNSSGTISLTGSVTSASPIAMPALISTGSAMVKQPYMPYDEITVLYRPTDNHTANSIIFQTNWLANSWACAVVWNDTGDYTFTITPTGAGTHTFGNIYLVNFIADRNSSRSVYQTTWNLGLVQVFSVNTIDATSTDANGYYTFRITNSNPSNVV